jgi:hypothetical protein
VTSVAPRLQGEIKRGRASLIGGIAVGAAVFALWLAITRDLGFDSLSATLAGVAIATVVGAWIRLADL